MESSVKPLGHAEKLCSTTAESDSFETAFGEPRPSCDEIGKANAYNCGEYHFKSKDKSSHCLQGVVTTFGAFSTTRSLVAVTHRDQKLQVACGCAIDARTRYGPGTHYGVASDTDHRVVRHKL
jgi:hypothetical protein